MVRLRVDIPEALDHKFRKKIANLFGFKRGAIRDAVVEALKKWISENNEPWVSVTDAVSFDVDPTVSIPFVSEMAHIFRTQDLVISLKTEIHLANLVTSAFPSCTSEDGEITATISVDEIEEFFNKIDPIISIDTMDSLLLEFEDGSFIVSGGQGCFYLETKPLSNEQKQEIINSVLTIHGKEEFAEQIVKNLPTHFNLLIYAPESKPMIVNTRRA